MVEDSQRMNDKEMKLKEEFYIVENQMKEYYEKLLTLENNLNDAQFDARCQYNEQMREIRKSKEIEDIKVFDL